MSHPISADRIVQVIAFAFLYFALAAFSIDLSRGSNGLAMIWLPNALAMGFVMLRRSRLVQFPALALGIALADILEGSPTFLAAMLGLANTAEIVLGAWLIHRWLGAGDRF